MTLSPSISISPLLLRLNQGIDRKFILFQFINYLVMKIHTLFLVLFFTYSCSTETEDKGKPENSPITDSRAMPNLEKSKSGSNKIKLIPPQIEVSEVTETSITLNWFDPINWETEEGGARQPEFLVESSTNPKLDNLVISRG